MFNALASVLLKIQATKGFVVKDIFSVSFLVQHAAFFAALFLFAGNVLLYAFALTKIPLSTAYPVMVVGSFLIVYSVSALYFHETIRWPQLIGYALVIGGIMLVVRFSSAVV